MKYALFLLAAIATLSIASISSAQVGYDSRDVVRDSGGNVVKNTFGNCVRTQWINGQNDCTAVAMNDSRVRRSGVDIGQEDRTVYFEFDRSTLTADAKRRLNSLADNLKSDDQVKDADIVGFADRMGSASYNERLSKKRAEAVQNYLVSRGFINSRVADTRWLGESAPVTNCSDNLSRSEKIACLQKDRRVELEINYLAN